jgi:hypothetical protein
LHEKGYSIDEIEKMLSEKIYDKDYIIMKFKECVNKIRERERGWDIKILDFILNNYQKKKIFYDPQHPVNEVFIEMGRKVLEVLNVPIYEFCQLTTFGDGREIFIYNCVKEALGLEFEEKYIRVHSNTQIRDKYMDLHEYIDEYVEWCYGE